MHDHTPIKDAENIDDWSIPLSPQTDSPVIDQPPLDRDSLKAIMRDVIAEVLQGELLKPLVNAAVAERLEFTRQQISAIDVAQRQAFEQFNTASTRMQTAADKFQDTARTVMETNGGLRATDAAQQQDISEIKDHLKKIDGRLESFDKRLDNAENKQVNLHADIHGSPTETNRQNVFTAIGLVGRKIDEMSTGLNARMDTMEAKLIVHDVYIARRRAVETWVVKVAKGLWEKQLTRWALITGLPLAGGLFVAAADPRIADGIAKFISLVLSGK